MTQQLQCLAKDPYTATHKVLNTMMILDSLTPFQRRNKIRDSITFSPSTVINLFNKSVRELTDEKDIQYMESLRRIYLDKYVYSSTFSSPDIRDVEDFVKYS